MIRDAAVIDVGSNSVRLVAYRLDGRAITPFLNEKVMAGLGRDLSATHALPEQGVQAAIAALKRFQALIEAHGIEQTDAVATAAVREAQDGPDFVRRVARETGVKLKIIDGAEEARLSALGVLAGEPDADGVVGDLGGSSLELVRVGPGGPQPGRTFPLGPLSLMRGAFNAEEVAARADEALADAAALQGPDGSGGAAGGDFYAVGGAWRALGRIDIALRDHPVRVLHHHEMSRTEALVVADFVRRQSRRSLEKLEEAAAKRADMLPYAATVLERVLRRGGFSRVILSSYGLREGLVFERLSARARAEHPLAAAAEAFAAPSLRARAFGAALERWIEPVFAQGPPVFSPARDPVLRAAAARLADVGAALHPDQRGDIVFELVVRAPFTAINHTERAFLAAAVHHRYSKAPPVAAAYEKLLSEEHKRAAAALGAALRLGADVSGRAARLLDEITLTLSGPVLTLAAKPARAHLITEQAAKRLDPLAAALGVTGKLASVRR